MFWDGDAPAGGEAASSEDEFAAWVESRSTEGRRYWYNTKTQEALWYNPYGEPKP